MRNAWAPTYRRILTPSRKLKYTRPEERAETKSFYAYKGRVEEAARADFDVYKVVRTAGIRGTPRIPPEPIDTSSLTIDAAHIAAHGHGVTKEEAVEFIKKAVCSTRTNMSTNYFSPAGAAYVDRKTGQINTAFKREEYQKRLENIMEEPGYGKE